MKHSRHRPFDNFIINTLGGIATYYYWELPFYYISHHDIKNSTEIIRNTKRICNFALYEHGDGFETC